MVAALYLCGMKARSGASKQAAPYAIPHICATR
jgi:hypothetical protein